MTAASKQKQIVQLILLFFVKNFDNKRIVSPDTRDVMLQTVSVLLQYPEYVHLFEIDISMGEHLMGSLITSFDSRFWIPITSILLRLWNGIGFCHEVPGGAVDCASPALQAEFRKAALKNPVEMASFLNNIFNNLNWTVTEFHVSLKEMEDAAKNRQLPIRVRVRDRVRIRVRVGVRVGVGLGYEGYGYG